MTLADIDLNSGRRIRLTRLKIFTTYEGLLEGHPTVEMNNGIVAAAVQDYARRHDRSGPRLHLIRPPRTPVPERRPGPFGPRELLPRMYCEGHFHSLRIDETLDEVFYRSRLTVIWFLDDISGPPAQFVTAAVADVPWEDVALDYEI
ncbi:hypothetical protein [Actinomadura sp. WMMB 499]|uniref:hypothetical protein n=1 Tax=Actinomadura sp. WMMB 499 TaxID=1219491 RepID=UPI0012455E87|nr:hypothetical protein [Actinomadura sp. WMMB 499]QFG21504.1 hypothetical protein F7P10_10550 [Actinomadura sp. WMMB 499]